MYTGKHARLRPLQPAFIMAGSGEAVTYRELEVRSNRLAHLFRRHGLRRLDHYAIFMENNSRYLEACGAGERSGLYFTCVNSYLTPSELAYILDNSQSRILVTAMLYSSGTTGRPKGILRPLPEQPPAQQLPLFDFLQELWQYREGMIYLSPAPLYHSAPQAAVNLTIRMGGTAIIMESFDPERYLQLVEQWGITHTQLVPTMFSRMLKLPEET